MRSSALSLSLALLGACTQPSVREPAQERAPTTPTQEREMPQPRRSDLDALALACDGAALRARLQALDELELAALADSPSDSIGLLALWERARAFDEQGRMRPEAVETLAAAIAGALGHPAPRWWLELIASAKQRPGDEAGPPYYDVAPSEHADRRGPWQPGPGHTRVRSGLDLVLGADGNGQLYYDLSSGRLELGPLPRDPDAMIELARARAGTTIYYASFSQGAGGFRFPLHAIAAHGQSWSAEVCGPDRKLLGGHGHLIVEIAVLERGEPSMQMRAPELEAVAVFSGETHGVALDVFDPETGARRLSWSSDFWFAR